MKKILGVLSAVFLLAICGVLTACGNPYKDMQFNIWYTYSLDEDDTVWHNGNNGIICNYGNENDDLQETDGAYRIYIKVTINNVKAKKIDDIIVTKVGTSSGIDFAYKTVNQGEVFSIIISGNAQTSLKFYETNSGKQTTTPLSIYRSLDALEIDKNVKPAVLVGGLVNLNSFANIKYYPLNLTNQTGVIYSITDIGSFNSMSEFVGFSGDYKFSYGEQDERNGRIITNGSGNIVAALNSSGQLEIYNNAPVIDGRGKYNLATQNNIFEIKATSVHNADIFETFYVYIVESLSEDNKPKILYENGEDIEKNVDETYKDITLYLQSQKYSSTILSIDTANLTSIYKNSLNLPQYEIQVMVDGDVYDLENSDYHHGVKIENVGSSNFKITAINYDKSFTTKISFAMVIKGLDFSNSNSNNTSALTQEITIKRDYLPNAFIINNEKLLSNEEITGVIYSSSADYKGLELNIFASPSNVTNNNVIQIIPASDNIKITGPTVTYDSNKGIYSIKSGETIYIKFAPGYTATSSSESLIIKTKSTPGVFNGLDVTEDTIEIIYNLEQMVTANALSIYAAENDDTISDLVYLDAKSNSSAFVRVYYSGNTLNASTITARSNNNNFKFAANNDTIINFSSLKFVKQSSDSVGKYNLYEMIFKANDVKDSALIEIIVADGLVDVGQEFTVNSVYIADSNNIQVDSNSKNITNQGSNNDGDRFYRSIVFNELIEFEVKAPIFGGTEIATSTTIDAISIMTDTSVESIAGFSISALSFTRIPPNMFTIKGIMGAKTQVLIIRINYYELKFGKVQKASKDIMLEIAVYSPIDNIQVSIENGKNDIAYVNSYFEDAKTTSINYRAYAKNANPSTEVVFTNETIPNATGVKLHLDKNISNSNIIITDSTGRILTGGETLTSQKIFITLTGKVTEYTSLTISFVPLRFGVESTPASSVTINFVEVEKADRIVISGSEIVSETSSSNYIYMSFMDVVDGGYDETSFNAKAHYSSNIISGLRFEDLGYILYEVDMNESGIAYDVNGNAMMSESSSGRLSITFQDDKIYVKANKAYGGGLFKLVIVAKDSYDDTTMEFKTSIALYLQISDGTINNPYYITSENDFYKINNDLTKHYVLKKDIELTNFENPIGFVNNNIVEFTGSLSGEVNSLSSDGKLTSSNMYKLILNIDISKNVKANQTSYMGLFAALGESSIVKNLMLVTKFTGTLSDSSTDSNINIGVIAAINSGLISNVELVVNASNITLGISGELNFGAIVGINYGTIDISKSTVLFDQPLNISIVTKANYNIGALVGSNMQNAEIMGAYQGISSLNEISFDVVADIELVNKTIVSSSGPVVNFAGVTGYNEGNISNLLIGGRLNISDSSISNIKPATGNLSGIAANSKGGDINTIAVLALDLISYCERIDVAGIVANASGNLRIDDVKFISSYLEFSVLSSELKTYGTISGHANVAGIVAVANSAYISYASLENFILGDFYTLQQNSTGTVAGLVAQVGDNVSIILSFVNINIMVTDDGTYIYTLAENSVNNSYFIGKISKLEADEYINFGNSAESIINSSTNYQVIYTDSKIIFNEYDLALSNFFNATKTSLYDVYNISTIYTVVPVTELEFESGTYYFKEGNNLKLAENYIDGTEYYTLDQEIAKTLYYADNNILKSNYKDNLIEEFNIEIQYYTLTEASKNILDLYLEKGSGYEKNDSTDIYINKDYWDLEFKIVEWEAFFSSYQSYPYALSSEYNNIIIEDIIYYFPHLTYEDRTPTLIISPKEMKLDINQGFVLEINSIYISDNHNPDVSVEITPITSTAIINYFNSKIDPMKYNTTLNTHKLFGESGIVKLTVLPAASQGGIKATIISGARYAYLTAENEIIFTGVSGTTPIIIKFYSLFNAELVEYVILYTQLGIDELQLASNDIYVTNTDEEGIDYEISTYTGANPVLMNFNAVNIFKDIDCDTIFNANIESHLYMDIHKNVNSYLTIERTSNNSLSGISIYAEDFYGDDSFKIEEITFELKLNLTSLYGDKVFPKIEGADHIIILDTVTLRVTIYRAATGVEIDGSDLQVVSTSANIKFNAELYTGFVTNNKTSVNDIESFVSDDGKYIELKEVNKDSIRLSITVDNDYKSVANNLLIQAKETNILNLFEFGFDYTPIISSELVVGYKYLVRMSLINEYNYRYLTEDLKLYVRTSATSNLAEYDEFELIITPEEVSTARISNYTATNAEADNNYITLITGNEIETSIISPGGIGGIMMLFIEPNYAHVKSATLISSTLYVPSIAKNVSIIFEQLVYNTVTGKYQTLSYSNEVVAGGIKLEMVSTIENGKTSYNGIIYIHTQLDSFSGMEATITATLTINTDNEPVIVNKHLLTQYMPGASLIYNGVKKDDGYLIQEDTYQNVVDVKIFGFEFNSNPDISVEWRLAQVSKEDYDQDRTKYFEYTTSEGSEYYEFIIINNKKYKFKKGNKDILSVAKWDDGNNNWVDSDNIDDKEILAGDYVTTRLTNSYNNITINTDGSYTLKLYLNVSDNIPCNFNLKAKMTLSTKESILTTSEERYLTFYPVDYLVLADSVYIEGLANNRVTTGINSQTLIQLGFNTQNETNDFNQEIFDLLLKYLNNDSSRLLELFSHNGNAFNSEAITAFRASPVDRGINIRGIEEFNGTITFSIQYGYVWNSDTGRYELKFSSKLTENSLTHTMTTSFRLEIYSKTTEDDPLPVYTAEDFANMVSGENYILMNDITLSSWTPLNLDIASFDGNNKIIKIESFAVEVSRTNYGIFDSIGTYSDVNGDIRQTLLKNVIIDYSQFYDALVLTNNNIKNVVFGGLVANNNGGLIYNCEVVNSNSANTKTVNILLDSDSDVNITFGALVGVNSGIITNSRVGTSGYTKIEAGEDYARESDRSFGGLEFVLGNSSSGNNQGFVSLAGGFAGENSGIISSSYFANSSLITYSTAEEDSKTAGFVGNNSGKISYSYVKAMENTITSNNPYSTGAVIESKKNVNVAGFVYYNSGEIDNSFANTELKSESAFLSGFVYENSLAGVISECYSACTINSEFNSDSAEQPFVGVDTKNQLLSFGTLKNCYYLIGDFVIKEEDGKDQAKGLNTENFNTSDKLNGFIFIESNSKVEREQGVWSYYTNSNQYHILPELNNANKIARSYRYFVAFEDEVYKYENAITYLPGSSNNPHIIRSVEEYNQIFITNGSTESSEDYPYVGNVRFINNIDFANDQTAIVTRTNFTLGDVSKRTLTSIEGNGMTIEGIYLDVSEAGDNSIGLFSEIVYAYVKNLNLKFASTIETEGQFSSVSVTYSGGLAGQIKDSAIINISLDGNNTTIAGKNFAGGLAGIITGKSMIYGIDSNLSVKAVKTDNNYYTYYNKTDFDILRTVGAISQSNYTQYLNNLSYAGGIAGVIDIDKNSNLTYNLSYITVNGNQMMDRTTADGNVMADYSGGVAGYANKNVSALRLKLNVGETTLIKGTFAVGGLFAVSMARIEASQVTAIEDIQYEYDTEFGTYIINMEEGNETQINKDGVGNINLLESYSYAGGLIGVSIGGIITNSYSKATFKNTASVIGGLIGCSVADSISYAYAVPYVNLGDNTEYVGGFIGKAYGIDAYSSIRNLEINEYIAILTRLLGRNSNEYTNMHFTFSTLLLDNEEVESIVRYDDEDNLISRPSIDYVIADGANYIRSNDSQALLHVFIGMVNNYNLDSMGGIVVQNSTGSYSRKVDLVNLYDVDAPDHILDFQGVFSTWPPEFWSLDDTRYFPLLLNEEASNYELIKVASDFAKILANPDGNFKIVRDIDMSQWYNQYSEGNFILPVTFTGILIGAKEEDNSTPTLSNILINANDTGDAGFFEATMGATIQNIIFSWKDRGNSGETEQNKKLGAIQINNEVAFVGGVSAYDVGSLFSGLTVGVKIDINNNVAPFSNNLVATGGKEKTIQGAGAIIGQAANSTIISCSVGSGYYVDLKNINMAESCLGGLVGVAISDEDSADSGLYNMIILSSSVASINGVIEFNINSISGDAANIGGLVGRSDKAAIASCNVGDYRKSDVSKQYLNITLNLEAATASSYVGGAVGYAIDTQLSTLYSITNINVGGTEGASDGTINKTHYYGGIAGAYNIVGATTGLELKYSYTVTNICDISVVTNAHYSAGVGSVSGSAVFNQNLFKGNISNRKIDNDTEIFGEITNIYSGGIAATVNTGSTFTINETLSSVVQSLGTDATNKIYAGGMIGQSIGFAGIINIKNSITTERITLSKCLNDAVICAGGTIGYAEGFLEFKNIYSVTSIIYSSLNPNIAPNCHMGALFGQIDLVKVKSENIKNTYYSTDIALVAEDSCLGINITAYALLFENSYLAALNSENAFATFNFQSGDKRLPYIASLYQFMMNVNIVKIDPVKAVYDYVLYSSLRPLLITSENATMNFSDSAYKSSYNYYLISSMISTESNSFNFQGELNGILIGGATEYDYIEPQKEYNDNGTYYYGIVPAVKKDSAISNIHININNQITKDDIDREVNFNSSILGSIHGIIVGKNSGLIFNTSVQGTGLDFNGGNDSSVGLIAGHNNGAISHSYSTAEIKSTDLGNLAGVVFRNEGLVSTSYFTGYINNTEDLPDGNGIYQPTSTAAGIVICGNDGNVGGYIYNTYMAGVITLVTNNSFSAAQLTNGSKIYIDKFSNSETFFDDLHQPILVSTAELMSAINLAGNWSTATAYNPEKKNQVWLDNSDKENESNTFGYNYCYPIYTFSQLNADGETRVTQYAFRTGKGDTNKDYFKIPHLGVLDSIRSIAYEQYLNYMLIYDIDGGEKGLNWTAVGSSPSPGQNTINEFVTEGRFVGNFVSNKYFIVIDVNIDNACVIKNLSGNGLFNNIDVFQPKDSTDKIASVFNAIRFGSMLNLKNSGALGLTVIGKTEVIDIKFEEDSKITGIGGESNYLGALFGEVNLEDKNDTLTLRSIDSKMKDQDSPAVILKNYNEEKGGTTGSIAGKLTSGNISIIESNIIVRFGASEYVGGLVGEMASGSIKETTIEGVKKINIIIEENAQIYYLGGLVGKKTGSEAATVEGFIVLFGNEIFTQNFGGFVSEVKVGEIIFKECQLARDGVGSIEITQLDEKADSFFGLLSAKVSTSATLNVQSFKFDTEAEIEYIFNVIEANNTVQAMGALVGYQLGDIIFSFDTEEYGFSNIKLSTNGANLGGIVGYYVSGTLNIYLGDDNGDGNQDDSKLAYFVTLQGTQNVGGAVGLVKSTKDALTEMIATDSNYWSSENIWDFLDSDNKFAEISVNTASVNSNAKATDDYKNFGGLFGVVDKGSHLYRYENGKTDDGKLKPIVNRNPINILEGNITVYNVGGVAGYTDTSTVKGLINEADFGQTEDEESNNVILYKSGQGQSKDSHPLLVNVGGIIGLFKGSGTVSSDAVASELVNKKEVRGYQNVGGLIGSLTNGATLTDREGTSGDSDESKTLSSGRVVGIMNVGGAVGYADKDSVIKNITIQLTVLGNAAVGGLIGYADGTTIENCKVSREIGEDLVEVKPVEIIGVVYQTEISNQKKDEPPIYSYIPTSIGGLAGIVVDATLKNNVVSNVMITTANEGVNGVVVSTISNYMAQYNNAGSSNYTKVEDAFVYTSSTSVMFDEIQSGIGGFVGTMDEDTALKTDEADKYIIATNKLFASINAEFGVNVGTVYGYYNNTESKNMIKEEGRNTILTPTIVNADDKSEEGNLYINGAYNLGGVVGRLDSGSAGFTGFDSSLIAGDKDKKVTINLAAVKKGTDTPAIAGTAMYVGGLFGKVANDINQLHINKELEGTPAAISIKIYTNESYFIGGLVGRLEGNMGTRLDEKDHNTVNNVVAENQDKGAISDFGGLVGMLKVKKGATFNNIPGAIVSGTHNYAFTVNTIENSNYADGESKFDVYEGQGVNSGNVYLMAQAYYINQDSFNISASENIPITNPLNPDAKGWHKDYTGFKSIRRNIPLSENNGAKWDSIETIYDASKITHVGTTTENKGTSEEYVYINYTIYEEYENMPTLYSAMGIATVTSSPSGGSYRRPFDNAATLQETNTWLNIIPAVKWFNKIRDKAANKVLEKMGEYYINANNGDLKSLKSINKNEKYTTIGDYLGNNSKSMALADNKTTSEGTDSEGAEKISLTYVAVTYFVQDYLSNSEGFVAQSSGSSTKGIFFIFDVIYDTPSPSGSIFEVSGVVNSVEEENKTPSNNRWILVAILIISGLLGIPLDQFISREANRLAQIIQSRVVKTMVTATLVYKIMMSSYLSANLSKDLFLNVTDQNFGYLSASYSRQIRYLDDSVVPESDAIKIEVDGSVYRYYSSIRPRAYYSAYYLGMGIVNGEEIIKTFAKDEISAGDTTFTDDEGTRYEIVRNFIYYNGCYYINADSGDIISGLAQTLDNMDTGSASRYTVKDGYYYAYGYFDGNSYRVGRDQSGGYYQGMNGNNLMQNSTSPQIFKINKFSDINISNLKDFNGNTISELTATEALNFSLMENQNLVDPGIEGYDYIEGAYYSANGVKFDGITAKPRTFVKYNGGGVPSGELYYDYIILDYRYQSGEDEWGPVYSTNSAYYTISDDVVSNPIDYRSYDTSQPLPDKISINLYPSSFINMYKNDEGIIVNDTLRYSSLNEDSNGIEHLVTYYYYEGGYVSHTKESNGETNIYTTIVDMSIYGKEELQIGSNADNVITINYQALLDDWDSYKDKNIYYKDSDGETQSSPVIDNYLKDGEKLWKRDTAYTVKEGMLHKLEMRPNEEEGNYISNTFLSNKNKDFYTRYKYTIYDSGLIQFNLEGEWIWLNDSEENSTYYLIPGKNSQFTNKNIYFLESAKVTLFGSKSLTQVYRIEDKTYGSANVGRLKIE